VFSTCFAGNVHKVPQFHSAPLARAKGCMCRKIVPARMPAAATGVLAVGGIERFEPLGERRLAPLPTRVTEERDDSLDRLLHAVESGKDGIDADCPVSKNSAKARVLAVSTILGRAAQRAVKRTAPRAAEGHEAGIFREANLKSWCYRWRSTCRRGGRMPVLPMPEHLRRQRGNPSKRPIRQTPRVELLATVPPPPEFLTPRAAEMWERVGRDLVRLHLLSGLDLNVLAGYCAAYGRWVACQEELLGASGVNNTHTLLKVARDSARAMHRHGIELGIVGAVRLGDPGPSADKFGGLVVG
jgi:P27 family predicted phage terminase small subunit